MENTLDCYVFGGKNADSNSPQNGICITTYTHLTIQVKRTKHAKYCRRGKDGLWNSIMDYYTWARQWEPTSKDLNTSVQTLDAVYRICRERWIIGMDGKNGQQTLWEWWLYIYIYIYFRRKKYASKNTLKINCWIKEANWYQGAGI